MLKTKKPLIVAVSMALGLGMAASVQAGPALISTPDGVLAVTNLDWSQTSFIAQGGTTAIANFVGSGGTCPVAGSCDFNVLTHASLTNFQNIFNVPINITTPGLNTTYEVTMIAKFTETVTGVAGNIVTFALNPTPTTVEFYFDVLGDATGIQSNPLTGAGYNDGRLVLLGTAIQASTGLFQVTGATPVQFDQAPNAASNDYGTQQTVTGSGNQATINVGGITQDPTFFLNQLINFSVNFSNISQSIPFNNVNPSDCFTQTALNLAVGTSNGTYACNNVHAAGQPYSGQGPALDANGYIPVTGAVNGLFPPTGGPDFVAQTDFNSGLDAVVVVPEPASLALVGLGLGLLGLGARRGRRLA